MVEEIKGPVISFPDSALREGKMSGVLFSLIICRKGRRRKREREIKIKLATSV